METNRDLIEVRREYVEWIRCELLGPGSEISFPDREHELISIEPDKRYSIGILFPQENKMEQDIDDTETEQEPEDENEEPEGDLPFQEMHDPNLDDPEKQSSTQDAPDISEDVGLAAQNRPSSCGLTFYVTGNTDKLICRLKWGSYRKAKLSDCRFPFRAREDGTFSVSPLIGQHVAFQDGHLSLKTNIAYQAISALYHNSAFDDYEKDVINAMFQMELQLRKGYVRSPHEAVVRLDLSAADSAESTIQDEKRELRITAVRYQIDENTWSVTVALVNDSHSDKRKNKELLLFQPELSIHTEEQQFRLTAYRNEQDFALMPEEDQFMEMLYRSRVSYGTGLGCAAEWEVDDIGNGYIRTEFMPTSEISPLTYSIPAAYSVDPAAFSMKHLSDLDTASREEKLRQLSTIADGYAQWIREVRERIPSLEEKYRPLAEKNLSGCEAVCRRIRDGIGILSNNEDAWKAFAYTNHAMLLQRVMLSFQKKMSDKLRLCDDPELQDELDALDYRRVDPAIHTWRPFQIAFLLMSIASVTSDTSPDRKLVDLIWFPTGGGKTEAYLGLTAMTIFYRRLHYRAESGGTAVLMRYTLRLLTGQQFTRASTLICACEYLRSAHEEQLGEEPITIGMWIGRKQTPNTFEDAMQGFDDLKKMDKANPFQVLKCPWCGASLEQVKEGRKKRGLWGYEPSKSRFRLICNNMSCFFSDDGLPVQIVDQALYRDPPTLLFSTVDKFAMLPWIGDTGHFFAANTQNRTPELIIQDELHLISGPLGSIVGLYESIIDYMCSSKGIPAKIIASTATIRRAREQCAALYDREIQQFPTPGIDAEDSFFSREAVIDHAAGSFGRLYVGLMPSGKTKPVMETSVISALMQRLYDMQLPDAQCDPYWTLLIYFSSLRELGKCRTLLDTDIRTEMGKTADRLRTPHRYLHIVKELTSNVSGPEITKIFDMLEKAHYSKADTEAKRYACDAVLATNMVSVGLDVERLNTMLIVSQPKLTSEYIQASSRIGRSHPGCAFILYDSSRSRDRSHYEQFWRYHQTFYQFVEPSGVTPFSEPAKERALHAIAISLMRHLCRNLTDEKNAGKFSVQAFSEEIDSICDYITKREQSIMSRIYPDRNYDGRTTEEMLRQIFDSWETLSRRSGINDFRYGFSFMPDKKKMKDDQGRLLKPFYSKIKDNAFETMTSMRSIDVTIEGTVIKWEKADES